MLPLTLLDTFEADNHQFRALAPDDQTDWLASVAAEYVKLRTECALPLDQLSVDGIQVLDVDNLRRRLKQATVPHYQSGNFGVVRSDFGETLCYLLLEQEYGTRFGYRGVRDRETIQQPGRGIDAVGIEDGDLLTLVLGEVKVSDEAASPPRVVDGHKDCLREQHRAHLADLATTSKKIWNQTRHVRDPALRDQLFQAALFLEAHRWDKLKVVACSVLIRPRARYQPADFGSFRACPDDYAPAVIRFLVICIPDDVQTVVQNWYATIETTEVHQ